MGFSAPLGTFMRGISRLFQNSKIGDLPRKASFSMSPRSRGVAQPGSAFVWGTKGRRFKSGRSDQIPPH